MNSFLRKWVTNKVFKTHALTQSSLIRCVGLSSESSSSTSDQDLRPIFESLVNDLCSALYKPQVSWTSWVSKLSDHTE